MKKLIITITIVLGMTLGASAQFFENNNGPQPGGGLFGKGDMSRDADSPETPLLPYFGDDNDADAEPLTDGVLLLAGLGAAYLLGKKRKE